jgi:hypothetical protein
MAWKALNRKGRAFDEQARSEGVTEARRYPRFRLEVDVTVKSPTLGLIPGMSVEMSDSGMSAVLPVEVPVGEVVNLRISLPLGPVNQQAVVRNRNAFRHGFEFADRERRMLSPFGPSVNET